MIATGVQRRGCREILGIRSPPPKDGAGWLAFFRDLNPRPVRVALVTGDAPRRPGGRDRRHALRSLAALQGPLRSQSGGSHPKPASCGRGCAPCYSVRPARRRISCCPMIGCSLTNSRGGRYADTARRLLAFAPSQESGAKSGPTTQDASAERYDAEPTSWASSRPRLDHPLVRPSSPNNDEWIEGRLLDLEVLTPSGQH